MVGELGTFWWLVFQHGVTINLISSLTSVGFDLALLYYSTSLYTGN